MAGEQNGTHPTSPRIRRRRRAPSSFRLHVDSMISALGGAFEGAGRAHPRQDWVPALRSADADLFPDLGLGRARSRDIARNGLGRGVLRTLVNHVIGHRGLWPQSRLNPELFGGDEEKAREAERQIEAAIKRKSRRMDTEGRLSRAQLQRLTFRSMLESGDVGWHLIPGPDGDPIIEVIEADRIATPPGKTSADGVREGVERDVRGVPVAYHVYRTHPGDTFAQRRVPTRDDFVRVPRYDADGRPRFLLFMEVDRPGQTRGIPEFLACADRFDDRAQGVKAALYQAITAAHLVYALEQDESVDEEDLEVDEDGTQFETMDYGAVKRLRPGQRLTSPNIQRPGPELANFIGATNAEIGASMGLPVEMVSLDFSRTTWHAARQGGLELSRSVRSRQEHFIDCGVLWVDQILVENAVLRGEIPAVSPELFYSDPDAFLALHYQFPVRGLVSPGEETQAATKAIDSGLSTLAEECAAKGLDWQDVLEQRKRESDTVRRLGFRPVDTGLSVALMPEWASASAQPAQPQQSQPEDDGAEEEDTE